MNAKRPRSLASLSEAEVNASRRLFVISFLVFVVFAIAVHVVLWQWRPWTWLSGEGSVSLDVIRATGWALYAITLQGHQPLGSWVGL
tara:strand:- start:396 stop:656 length:261 start_codon:yes stop_codon:yes gene_type:complete